MDAFYASVEQRDNPKLRGKPVIIGGDPRERGVVATCSYEARIFGVHSAMPVSVAYRLCPKGIFVRPRFEVYEEVSEQIRDIFHEYTDLVEPLSLDEAYLDVTHNKKNQPSATLLAKQIKEEIYQKTHLTASAGVSFNKFLAKTASDWQKPNGLTVIPPNKALGFIEKLPIGKFHGVGRVTEKKMKSYGINTGSDLRKYDRATLIRLFGKVGGFYYDIAHMQDHRPVNPFRTRKSYGREITFQQDIKDLEHEHQVLKKLAEEVASMLQEAGKSARTITLKVRYEDFTTITRSHTQDQPYKGSQELLGEAINLLNATDAKARYIRLLGVAASNLQDIHNIF